MENEPFDNVSVEQVETPTESLVKKNRRFKLPSKKVLYTVAVVIIVLVSGFFAKSFFVAAMVNGSFISKASFVKEMESRTGQEVLDSLITTKLVKNKVGDVEVDESDIDAEVKKTEDQLTAQGTTLEQALTTRNITEEEFRNRITLQKQLEKFLGDKLAVTDAEVTKYIKDNKVSMPKGTDKATFMAQVSAVIKQSKFDVAVQELIDSLRAEANIRYFVNLK